MVNPQILQSLGVPAQGLQAAAALDLRTHATLKRAGNPGTTQGKATAVVKFFEFAKSLQSPPR